jgi:LacI family transcriptional regulator
MATMADVARRAGVALSTVSHVINRTRHVSAETVAAVERAMRELDYAPNTLARSLARARTNTVGLAISTVANVYFADIIQAVENACARLGWMVFLADTVDDPDQELRAVRALHQRRVDGVILAPSPDPDGRAVAYLRRNGIACVLLDRMTDPAMDQVGVENRASVGRLVAHLVEHGHRRIGMLSNQAGLATTFERIEGFKAGLATHGIDWDPSLLEIGSSDRATNRLAALRLLDLPQRPTAMVTGNNFATICMMHAFRERALRVPDDVALACFDDFEWADAFEPQLTVIAQPCRQIGETAADLLAARIADRNTPPRSIQLQPTLVVRHSCGCR